MRTGLLGAMSIERQGMLLKPKSLRSGDLVLPFFNAFVEEFLHTPTVEADEVVVMAAFVEFKHRLA